MQIKHMRNRAKNSTYWVTFGYLVSQLLRLSSNLIMTRLLVPEMFGVMALVTVFMSGISMFSDVGLQQNIVQSKRGDTQVYLNTAWTIQILRGFCIFLIALFISLVISYLNNINLIPSGSVYTDSSLPFLLAFMSITALIGGFNSINLQLLNRKLMISKVTIIEMLSQIVGLCAMLSVAYYWREVWVLVIAGIISALVKMILSHHSSLGDRPRFALERKSVNEIVSFGKWIFLGSIIGFFLSQGDRLLLGGLINSELLGIYSIAFFMANALKGALKKLISAVFYPMLSEIVRDSPEKLKLMYYRLRLRIDLITMSVGGILASTGSDIINFLYDARYEQAGWMFEMLSISLLFVGYSLAGACLMARGNAKSHALLIFYVVIFLYVGLPLAFHYHGIVGAIFIIAINYIVDIPSTFYMMHKEKLLDIKREFIMLPLFPIAYLSSSYLLKFLF